MENMELLRNTVTTHDKDRSIVSLIFRVLVLPEVVPNPSLIDRGWMMNSLYFEDELQPMRPINQLMYIQSASLSRIYLRACCLTQATYCS